MSIHVEAKKKPNTIEVDTRGQKSSLITLCGIVCGYSWTKNNEPVYMFQNDEHCGQVLLGGENCGIAGKGFAYSPLRTLLHIFFMRGKNLHAWSIWFYGQTIQRNRHLVIMMQHLPSLSILICIYYSNLH